MLKRNVYILYPAGFSGSYVRWAINAADQDQRTSTPLNPLNNAASSELGGTGTAHKFIRIPTHQTLFQHMSWVLANRPIDKRVYVLNVAGDQANSIKGDPEIAAGMLLRYDPEGVIINIHDGNDPLIAAYGDINCVTKWPTYLAVEFSRLGITQHNPFDCNTMSFRNFMLENTLLHRGRPLDMVQLKGYVERELNWFKVRGTLQPHEVNAETYPHLEKLKSINLNSQVFELSCRDVATAPFKDFIDQFLMSSDVSTKYDTTYVRNFHQNYTDAQPNLQWFKSHAQWKNTGEVDDYLRSHAIIQVQFIKEIFRAAAAKQTLHKLTGWQTKTIDEINNAYHES